MTTIAILDKDLNLVGIKRLGKRAKMPKDAVVVVDEIDLPLDGTYRWVPKDECFMPQGHGHGKPGPAPISADKVLYLMARAMENPPQEIRDWVKWYKKEID